MKVTLKETFREGYLKGVDTMMQETTKEMSELEKQRDAYKQELFEVLQTLSDSDTQFAYSAHLRLEELLSEELSGESHVNIC